VSAVSAGRARNGVEGRGMEPTITRAAASAVSEIERRLGRTESIAVNWFATFLNP
jgi:hypothetical protein